MLNNNTPTSKPPVVRFFPFGQLMFFTGKVIFPLTIIIGGDTSTPCLTPKVNLARQAVRERALVGQHRGGTPR